MITTAASYINVMDYGVKGDGVQDDTLAIQNLLDRVAPVFNQQCNPLLYLNGVFGAPLFFPPGLYLVTDTLNIDNAQTQIIGAGIQATFFLFYPVSDDGDGNILFKFSKDTDSILQYCGVSNLSIQSTDSTMTKTAIYLRDSDLFTANHVNIFPWGGSLDQSIGIHMRGRDLTNMKVITICCDRPIVFSPTGYEYNGVADHFHLADFASTCTDPNGKHIYVEPSSYLTHVTFDGYQAWSLGAYGFYWDVDDGLTPGVDLYGGVHLMFANVRAELNHDFGTESPGYTIHINCPTQQVAMQNCFATTLAHGYSLDKINHLSIDSCSYGYPGQSIPTPDKVALSLGDDCENVTISNFCYMSPSQKIISDQLAKGADFGVLETYTKAS